MIMIINDNLSSWNIMNRNLQDATITNEIAENTLTVENPEILINSEDENYLNENLHNLETIFEMDEDLSHTSSSQDYEIEPEIEEEHNVIENRNDVNDTDRHENTDTNSFSTGLEFLGIYLN